MVWRIFSASQPTATCAAIKAPPLVPPIWAIGMRASSNARSTPMWAKLRAPPPLKTSDTPRAAAFGDLNSRGAGLNNLSVMALSVCIVISRSCLQKAHAGAQPYDQAFIAFSQLDQHFQHVAVALFCRVARAHPFAPHQRAEGDDTPGVLFFGEGVSVDGGGLADTQASQVAFVHFGAHAQAGEIGQAS